MSVLTVISFLIKDIAVEVCQSLVYAKVKLSMWLF